MRSDDAGQQQNDWAPCGPGGRRPERIDELLTELATYWHRYPEQRLGQILDNFAGALAAAYRMDNPGGAVREIEDEALIGMLKTRLPYPDRAARYYLNTKKGRNSNAPAPPGPSTSLLAYPHSPNKEDSQ